MTRAAISDSGPVALGRPVLIGLVGEGVKPSLTPPMHEAEGARHGLRYIYRTVDLAPGQGTQEYLQALFEWAPRLGFNGLNITHPIKQAVLPYLDRLSDSATSVQAVNTVTFVDGSAVGHNTDVSGFGAAFDATLGDARSHRVVLVGAGGAGAAVASALAHGRVDELVIVDGDAARANALVDQLSRAGGPEADGTDVRTAKPADLEHEIKQADGVVNATPIGMAAHPGTAFDPDVLRADQFVADIVYRPVETALVVAARERGCRVMSGLGMAMNQAADAFEIFTNEQADRRHMLTDLENLVAAEANGTTATLAPMKGQNP